MESVGREERLLQTLSALSLGALVGILVGLSIHAVVGSTLTALLALLGGYFGLRENERPLGLSGLRIGVFSLACLTAIIASLYIRTHNLLSPDLEGELNNLKARHVLRGDDVRLIILFRKYGLVPTGFTRAPQEASPGDSVLFADQNAWDCPHLRAELFANPQARLEAMRSSGGAWATLAERVSKAEPRDRDAAMQQGFAQICGR